jgi:hypothetical protein
MSDFSFYNTNAITVAVIDEMIIVGRNAGFGFSSFAIFFRYTVANTATSMASNIFIPIFMWLICEIKRKNNNSPDNT